MSRTPSAADGKPLVPALLRIAFHANTERFTTWLASSEYDDIQPAHSAVFQPLWEQSDGARVTALARGAHITKQSMSALVDHLEVRGYVERVADPHDARAARVRLTARGRAYVRAVRSFGRKVEAEWARRIGARRFEELRSALLALRESLVDDQT
jgi:DNA-binding MarR family transcriptional regulator